MFFISHLLIIYYQPLVALYLIFILILDLMNLKQISIILKHLIIILIQILLLIQTIINITIKIHLVYHLIIMVIIQINSLKIIFLIIYLFLPQFMNIFFHLLQFMKYLMVKQLLQAKMLDLINPPLVKIINDIINFSLTIL